jgi:hypothetical protein
MILILKRFFNLPSPLLVLASVLILIASGSYSHQLNKKIDKSFRENLTESVGTDHEVCISYIYVVSKINKNVIGIDRKGREYKIHSKSFHPEINKTYAFKGHLSKDNILILTDMTEYPLRPYKYLFSAISVFIVLYLILCFIRYDRSEKLLYIKLYKARQ